MLRFDFLRTCVPCSSVFAYMASENSKKSTDEFFCSIAPLALVTLVR